MACHHHRLSPTSLPSRVLLPHTTPPRYHLAATFDGSTVALHINGSLDVEAQLNEISGHAEPRGSVVTAMSNVTVGDGLFGAIAEVGVYSNALAGDEVEGLARHGLWPVNSFDSVA